MTIVMFLALVLAPSIVLHSALSLDNLIQDRKATAR